MDEDRLSTLKSEFANLEPDLVSAKDFLEKSIRIQIEADEAMRNWNQSFETFQQAAESPQRMAEVEKARIEVAMRKRNLIVYSVSMQILMWRVWSRI